MEYDCHCLTPHLKIISPRQSMLQNCHFPTSQGPMPPKERRDGQPKGLWSVNSLYKYGYTGKPFYGKTSQSVDCWMPVYKCNFDHNRRRGKLQFTLTLRLRAALEEIVESAPPGLCWSLYTLSSRNIEQFTGRLFATNRRRLRTTFQCLVI